MVFGNTGSEKNRAGKQDQKKEDSDKPVSFKHRRFGSIYKVFQAALKALASRQTEIVLPHHLMR